MVANEEQLGNQKRRRRNRNENEKKKREKNNRNTKSDRENGEATTFSGSARRGSRTEPTEMETKNKTPKQKTKTKSGNVALKMTPKVEPREPSVENKIREGNQTNTKRKETVPSGTRGKLGNNKKKQQPKTR